ncbi:MAG: glutamine--fructose-6-phosphate transaminase (isomerizing) [Thermanaerothrix sp.]|nr:glutamine--fructose-6-phosphate transaminase (isomerizing) [Thermanaerothrix sp.]
MCGVVGYVGPRKVVDVLLDGLRRLEYRGYDSAGLAIHDGVDIKVVKDVGKVSDLASRVANMNLEGGLGVGHTRWATHGGVTGENAHPHADSDGKFVLVHNGIVENYLDIKDQLEREGVSFVSQTDSEVVVQLLSKIYNGDMVSTLVELQRRLDGSYALVILNREDPGVFYCVRKGSPLVLGVAEGEGLCASDVPPLLPFTKEVIYMDEGEIAEVRGGVVRLWDREGQPLERFPQRVDWDVSMAEKDGYPHYMAKEIHEQGTVLRSTLKGRLKEGSVDLGDDVHWTPEFLGSLRRIHLVACGTSYYACLVAERVLERWTTLDVKVDIASEYRYRDVRIGPDTLAVFVSQSGETADTLAAQRKVRAMGGRCLGITNVRGSTLAREVHDLLLLKAGPEIGVAATKTFMGQLGALYLLALKLGWDRGDLNPAEAERLASILLKLPYEVERVLERESEIKKAAEKFSGFDNFLFLGRGFSYPIALEGALKLKEISYVHAEAYAAGEMKHGPIALLEPNVPVMVVIPKDGLYEKTLSNVQEARARRSPVVAVASDGDDLIGQMADMVVRIPRCDECFSPFLSVIPLQMFAYHVALLRGREIDQPRNLAKSVTVE